MIFGMKEKKEIYLLLENIRSAQNVGAIFRTADACGVSKLFLVGYTPCPLDRFGRFRSDISKSALGAEQSIPWEHFSNTKKLLEKLKKEDAYIVSVEQNNKSIDYKKFQLSKIKNKKTIFVLGNEVSGVSVEILKNSNKIIEIPMVGKKESLNVSVSAGVVLFRILNI